MATLLGNNKPDIFVSGGDNFLHLDNITVAQTGTAVKAGTVMAKLANGKYQPYGGSGATAPLNVAVGVLVSNLVAYTGDTKAVLLNSDAELRRGALTGLDTAAETALRALNIKVRGSASLPGISTPAL